MNAVGPRSIDPARARSNINMSAAPALAAYVTALRFEQLPAGVLHAALRLVVDNVGCAIGAQTLAEGGSFLKLAQGHSGPRAARAIGGALTTVDAAVFCNSSLANLLDFDDMHHYFLPYHLGSLIVPAAVSVGESVGATGRDVLTAIVAAYEVTMRVGRSLGSGLWKAGLLHAFRAVAQVGPAVAAAKLYGLTAAELRTVFSVLALEEGVSAPLNNKHDVPATLQIGLLKGNMGSLAELGARAALKGQAGLSGGMGMLELSAVDWCRAGLPAAGFDTLTEGLGEVFLISQMSLKATPSCWLSQPPITAAWNALGGRRIDATHVARIRIVGVPRLERVSWSSLFDAQFSLPCALALAVSSGQPGPKWYTDRLFEAPHILALAAKVVQETDPAAELAEIRENRMSCRVAIELKDGAAIEGECHAVKGTPDNPLTQQEQDAKWSANTAHLPDSLRRDILLTVRQLPQASTLSELSAALAAVPDRAEPPAQ